MEWDPHTAVAKGLGPNTPFKVPPPGADHVFSVPVVLERGTLQGGTATAFVIHGKIITASTPSS